MAPPVGRPIDAAEIFVPASREHCVSLSGLETAALPASNRTAINPTLRMFIILSAMLKLLRQRDADGARLRNECAQRSCHVGIERGARNGAAYRGGV